MSDEKDFDLQELIDQSRDESLGRKRSWEGTVLDFLKMVKDSSPELKVMQAGRAAQRVNRLIRSLGVKDCDPKLRLPNEVKEYAAFSDELFGIEETIHQIMEFFSAADEGAEIGRRFLTLVGPPGGGKDTFIAAIFRLLERHGYFYALSDCAVFDSPLNIISPRDERDKWSEILGVKIDDNADICFQCRQRLLEEKDNKGHYLYRDIANPSRILWEKFPVKLYTYSERGKRGLAIYEPGDSKSEDISKLTGRPSVKKMGEFEEDDPRVYNLRDGKIPNASRGVLNNREYTDADKEIIDVFISLCQEGKLKTQEGSFPHLYVDVFTIGTTNMNRYNKFLADKMKEALKSRMYTVSVPYNLRWKEEVKIYRKFFKKSAYGKIHHAPQALEVAALFAVISRYKQSELCPDLIKKARYYNGELVNEKEQKVVDIEELRLEGKKAGEGLTGIGVRFVTNALDLVRSRFIDRGCVTPHDVLLGIEEHFDHATDLDSEELKKFKSLIPSVREWYNQSVLEEVSEAFIHGYSDVMRTHFDNYMREVRFWREVNRGNKKKVKDEFGDRDPDEKMMREIESHAGVPESGKADWRRGILEMKGMIEGAFTLDSYPALRDALRKKLLTDIKPIMDHAIADPATKDPDTVKRRIDARAELARKGYCDKHCIDYAMAYASRVLKEKKE